MWGGSLPTSMGGSGKARVRPSRTLSVYSFWFPIVWNRFGFVGKRRGQVARSGRESLYCLRNKTISLGWSFNEQAERVLRVTFANKEELEEQQGKLDAALAEAGITKDGTYRPRPFIIRHTMVQWA